MGSGASDVHSSVVRASLLEHLLTVQGSTGVQLEQVEFNDWAGHPSWRVTLQGEWGMQLDALHDLEQLPDFFTLEEIRLAPQIDPAGSLRSELVISQAVPVLDSASRAEVRLPHGNARTYSHP